MKSKLDNIYVKWALTLFSVIAASILLYFFMLRFNDILSAIGKILYILKPLLYGIVIAFLLTQIFNHFDSRLTKLLAKKYDITKSKSISKVLSIIISILILLLLIFFIFYILIPKTVISLLGVIESWPENMKNIETWIRDVLSSSPVLEEQILSAVNNSSNSIIEWISTGILPQMEKISSSVTTGLNDVYIFLKDFIIGIVFSIYIVANKNKFIAQLKKIIYTIFGIILCIKIWFI